MRPTLVIVDDSAAFAAVARTLLERDGFEVVGTASTTDEALERVPALQPRVVLVDLHLGTESGLDLARRLADLVVPATSIVLMSTHSEGDFADLIQESRAAGFVAKERLAGAALRELMAAGLDTV